jgi:hypothetical protein
MSSPIYHTTLTKLARGIFEVPVNTQNKTKNSVSNSQQANYTERSTAAVGEDSADVCG